MSASGSTAASSSSLSFTTLPLIPCEKLVGAANYAGWAAAVELCVLWYSIDVWAKAKKTYSNDVNRLYKVVSDPISMKKEDMDMQSYLGKLDSLIADFDALMPFTDSADKHAEQRGKFFMVLALAGLPPELDSLLLQPLLQPPLLPLCRLTLLHLSQILISEVAEAEDVDIIDIDPVVPIATNLATLKQIAEQKLINCSPKL
ncbi:hypothetical protein TSUD_281620 [Trifolium subterraneum]|uniref:Retrotransposon Copia-like N-terminal domain-containing protein n=1 Tax=Trifolium subterraneum TaxID=3900 RepID=A0A2Z6MW74_TRISU|nr:hypothetical protein TSUD_281620 [Trifolium subterraneum]